MQGQERVKRLHEMYRRPYRGKADWRDYERFRAVIAAAGLTSQQYEAEIRRLCAWLRL